MADDSCRNSFISALSHLGTQEDSDMDISTSTPKPKGQRKPDPSTSLMAALAGTVVNLLNCQLAAQLAMPQSSAAETACYENVHRLVLQKESEFISLGLGSQVSIARQLADELVRSKNKIYADKSTGTEESCLPQGTIQPSPEINQEPDQPDCEEQREPESPGGDIVPGSCPDSPAAVAPQVLQQLKRIPPHVMDKLKKRITPRAPLMFERRRKRIPLGQLSDSRRLDVTFVSPNRQSVLPQLLALERWSANLQDTAAEDGVQAAELDEADGHPVVPQLSGPFEDSQGWLKTTSSPCPVTRQVPTRAQRDSPPRPPPPDSSSDKPSKRRKLWAVGDSDFS